MMRYQQGVPVRPHVRASTLSYGSVRFLAEPIGHAAAGRHPDHRPARREERDVRTRRDISVFFDLYNMFNANPAQNLQWSSGTAWNRPLSIVPPRLARIGVKLNF